MKITPVSGFIHSVLELEPCSDADRPRASNQTSDKEPKRMRLSENNENNFLPHLKAKKGTELQLTEFPDKNYPEGSSPSEITKHSLDSSFMLGAMLNNYSQ